jgi:hypothetical protein
MKKRKGNDRMIWSGAISPRLYRAWKGAKTETPRPMKEEGISEPLAFLVTLIRKIMRESARRIEQALQNEPISTAPPQSLVLGGLCTG